MRKGQDIDKLVKEETKHSNLAGPITFVLTTAVSVYMFAKAEMPTVQFYGIFTGPGAENGDWTAAVGFVSAAIIYYALATILGTTKKK
jgi:hypothetical protein